MKDKLDIKQVFLKIKALYCEAKYQCANDREDIYNMNNKYIWIIGIDILDLLRENINMLYDESIMQDEPNTICGIPILKIDFYNPQNIKLYKEIS